MSLLRFCYHHEGKQSGSVFRIRNVDHIPISLVALFQEAFVTLLPSPQGYELNSSQKFCFLNFGKWKVVWLNAHANPNLWTRLVLDQQPILNSSTGGNRGRCRSAPQRLYLIDPFLCE